MAACHSSKMPATFTHLQLFWRCFQPRLRDFVFPMLGNDKDFKWTKHFILASTALTQLQLAEERKTKRIYLIYSREASWTPSVLSSPPPPMQPFLYYTFVLLRWAPSVLALEPEVPTLPWIHIWKVNLKSDWQHRRSLKATKYQFWGDFHKMVA